MCLGMANGYRAPEKEKSDFVISDKDGKLVVNYNGPKNTSKICGAFTIIEDDVTESKIEIAKEIVLNEMFDVIKEVVKNHEEFFIIKDLSEEDDPLGTIEFKKGFSVGAKAILPTVIISDSEDFLASRKVTFIDSGQSDIGTINELKRKLTEKDAEIQKLINERAYLKRKLAKSPENRFDCCICVERGEIYTKSLADYDKLLNDIKKCLIEDIERAYKARKLLITHEPVRYVTIPLSMLKGIRSNDDINRRYAPKHPEPEFKNSFERAFDLDGVDELDRLFKVFMGGDGI